MESISGISLDDLFSMGAIGPLKTAIGKNLTGFNHRQTPTNIPYNKDVQGLTFFTRPQLNLRGPNVRNVRTLYPLLNTNETSIQRYVRCTLDPRLMVGDEYMPPMTCPWVRNEHAFISVLTNNIMSVSGWDDLTTPVFTSDRGNYNEAYCQVDGILDNYEVSDMDVTFRNLKGDVIIYLFYVWMRYQSYVFEGKMVPYPDMLVENRLDYMTRMYRLVLDPTKTFVTKIAATGLVFPIGLSIGQFFDFNEETPFNEQTKEITVRFKVIGKIYLEDILIKEFNETVKIFNPIMKDKTREAQMQKIPMALLQLFNHEGFPRINPNNDELEWWLPNTQYARVVNALGNNPTSSEEQIYNDYQGD